MKDELVRRAEALYSCFLTVRSEDPETYHNFLAMNEALYTWSKEQGIDDYDVQLVINKVGSKNPSSYL